MYRKLRGKIIEVFGTLEAFAEKMEFSKTQLSQRLNGRIEWRVSEIAKACDLLHIPYAEAYIYFFM